MVEPPDMLSQDLEGREVAVDGALISLPAAVSLLDHIHSCLMLVSSDRK